MDTSRYRAEATEVLKNAEAMNASYEHPETKKQGNLAAIILSLCDEVDRLAEEIINLGGKKRR